MPFAAMDARRDGRVTYEEFRAAQLRQLQHEGGRRAQMAAAYPNLAETRLRQRFEQLDADHDGTLEAREWVAAGGAR